jgi:hypothetical protein
MSIKKKSREVRKYVGAFMILSAYLLFFFSGYSTTQEYQSGITLAAILLLAVTLVMPKSFGKLLLAALALLNVGYATLILLGVESGPLGIAYILGAFLSILTLGAAYTYWYSIYQVKGAALKPK